MSNSASYHDHVHVHLLRRQVGHVDVVAVLVVVIVVIVAIVVVAVNVVRGLDRNIKLSVLLNFKWFFF